VKIGGKLSYWCTTGVLAGNMAMFVTWPSRRIGYHPITSIMYSGRHILAFILRWQCGTLDLWVDCYPSSIVFWTIDEMSINSHVCLECPDERVQDWFGNLYGIRGQVGVDWIVQGRSWGSHAILLQFFSAYLRVLVILSCCYHGIQRVGRVSYWEVVH